MVFSKKKVHSTNVLLASYSTAVKKRNNSATLHQAATGNANLMLIMIIKKMSCTILTKKAPDEFRICFNEVNEY